MKSVSNTSTQTVTPKATTTTAKKRCEANIRGCSETALCEVATYTAYNKKEWARGNSFVKFATEAKRRGLTCGVKEESNYLTAFRNAKKKCEKNIQTCSTTDICLLATYKVKDGYRWQSAAFSTYVSEAKRRGLTCGVKLGSNKLTAKQRCEANIRGCSETALCEVATYTTYNNKKEWARGNSFVKFATEAKRRGLTCGVKSADTCKSNIKNCTNGEICKQLKLSNESETKKYFLEAESRGLSCGAKPLGNPEKSLVTNCPTDVTQCDEKSLCDTATWISAGNKKWKLGAYTQYVDEAKRRGLTCGIDTNSAVIAKKPYNKPYNEIECTVEYDQPSKGIEYINQQVNKFVKEAKGLTGVYIDHDQPFEYCKNFDNVTHISFGAGSSGIVVRLRYYEKENVGFILMNIAGRLVAQYIYRPDSDYEPIEVY